MWLLVLAGLFAVSMMETGFVMAEKPLDSSSADDLVMLEIDVKEPAKRSPVSASAVYGASPSQFVIRHGDDAQELAPEYLSVLQQYTQTQPYSAHPSDSAPQRRPQPAYARQQQNLQQAYQNSRVPAVAPPRPRVQLHPQALAQAEAVAQAQALADAQDRAEALHTARYRASPSNAPASYIDPKLGTFEQELLQLVSANQAQEYKLLNEQSKRPQYSQEYVQAPASALPQEEQYHIETTAPRQSVSAYQAPIESSQQQYRPPARQYVKAFRPSPQYPDPAEQAQLNAHRQAEAQAVAQAQAQAEAQALAFQRISHASHDKHQQSALEQIRVANEQHRKASALEQINQGDHISEAGQSHLIAQAEEQAHPRVVDPELQLKAQLKAQANAESAAARRAQEAAEYKAHADAILHLQAQQQAHLRAQEDAHKNALSLERNQLRAQAHAQALANAQAEELYKAHQQARNKAQGEAQAAAKAQYESRKVDPENTPVIQYLLPNAIPLPSLNSYHSNNQAQKYQAVGSASSHVQRSANKAQYDSLNAEEQAYAQSAINQPRQAHKHKGSFAPQSSAYVSQSGLQKKSPTKSLTIEEIIEQDQLNSPQVVRLPAPKGQQPLTQDDLAALINAGYTVTPVPDHSGTHQAYGAENSSPNYYTKKQRSPAPGAEYERYVDDAQRQRRPIRKQRPILTQGESDGEGSEKVTYLVPSNPTFGTRQTPHRRPVQSEE